jgi:hypothetical protein
MEKCIFCKQEYKSVLVHLSFEGSDYQPICVNCFIDEIYINLKEEKQKEFDKKIAWIKNYL